MKRSLLLPIGILGWLVLSASAQVSYTTTNDFGFFNSGGGTVSSLYYSDSSTVNGIGNPLAAGGAGGIGALQLTATGGWSGWLAGSDFAGPTAGFFSAIDPGGSRPYSPESGYGPGTLVANSGTISFDIYRGNFTDWNWFGVNFNYDGYWGPFWATTSTDFTGADGQTWTHFEVPFTINATAGITYFGMGIAQNAGAIAGQTFYIDNFQVAVVPEPGTFALLGLSALSAVCFRRRASR
jgi:hypothetical protein